MFKDSRCLLVFLDVLTVAPVASANSVSLGHVNALQNNGFTQVDLFSNPGINLHPTSFKIPQQLSILVPFTGIVPGGGDTLVVSALMMGSMFSQNFAIAPGSYPNISQFVTFNFPEGVFHRVPVNLSVQLFSDGGRLLESSNYSFKFTEAVPEPGTMLLLGSGIVAAVVRKFRSAQ
jgi:hypothetical protein